MSAVFPQHHWSVEDYLKLEASAPERHEYVAGSVYSMAGSSLRHNEIAGNLFGAFLAHLRGGPCRPYMSDVKVRLQVEREDIFYYPDVVVSCGREGVEEYYLRCPRLIVEVLPPSTEATDRREKALNYPHVSTLEEYLLVAQDRHEITVHRRNEAWRPQVIAGSDAVVEFQSIRLSLPLAQIYESVAAAAR